MKMPEIHINGRRISRNDSPYIIAELSANHNGSLDQAFRLIQEAQAAGADAIKLQTYRPDTITLKCETPDFRIEHGLWAGRTLYELYEEAHTPWEWHRPLFDFARKKGITIFSSPFDETSVDFLEDLGAPAYKIASFEAVDLPLIRYVASTKKPLIISTGMATRDEIFDAVATARDAGCNEIALLRCVSAYPARPEDYNLRTIPDMESEFGCVIGLSDHTIENSTAVASVALGASLIEKHFTLDRNAGGPDDSFSLEPSELNNLVSSARAAWLALGGVSYGPNSGESENTRFRRSLYFVQDMKEGQVITRESVRSVRPGFGLPPKQLPELLGKKVSRDVRYGEPVTLKDINLSV